MLNQYLTILIESLQKKSKVLEDISAYNERQSQLFKSGDASLESFDGLVEEKGKLIDALVKLDEGFETLYERIADEVVANKDLYADQIRQLQEWIKKVTDQSVAIQAQEARNKDLVENYFRNQRQQLKTKKQSSQVAINYYKNMSRTSVVPPQFLDSKK
ncbi:MAG: flagellar protein FliT [Lachnospiraceae bacterium]|nr:flagellar protein FliT [Lachnospiraceae bacterium]